MKCKIEYAGTKIIYLGNQVYIQRQGKVTKVYDIETFKLIIRNERKGAKYEVGNNSK